MSALVRHPSCGKTWIQHGNRSGHCAKCHNTFEGDSLFSAHQRIGENGEVTCLDPADMTHSRKPLRFVEEPGSSGTWRGPEMPEGIFRS